MRGRQWSKVKVQWSILIQKVLLAFCFLLCTDLLSAQKISTILSKEKIVIGEQAIVKISVEGITTKDVLQDFNFPDTVNHLEILSDSVDGDGPDFIHTLVLTSFDSGYWQFPSFELMLSGNRKVTSQALDITVLPVDVSYMADYHDIKDILDIEPENSWWIIAAIVLTSLLSLFAFLWVVSNKTPQQEDKLLKTDIASLYNTLIKDLERWPRMNLSEHAPLITFFRESSQNTRSFADAAYRQNASHLTTGEYIVSLKGKLPDAATENEYFQFLRLADAVKFAKYIPGEEEVQSTFPILRKFIDQVFEQNKLQS